MQPEQPPLENRIIVPGDEGIKSPAAALGYVQLITDTERAKYGLTFVVMDKHRTTIMKSPGEETPFQTKRFKYAEQIAKEAGGVVESLLNAIKLVATSPCNLPKDSKFYSPDPAAAKVPSI